MFYILTKRSLVIKEKSWNAQRMERLEAALETPGLWSL